MTEGIIRTIALNNIDVAEVEEANSSTLDKPNLRSYLIVRTIGEQLTLLKGGDSFFDFRERVYDIFGRLLRERKFNHMRVESQTHCDGKHVLLVSAK